MDTVEQIHPWGTSTSHSAQFSERAVISHTMGSCCFSAPALCQALVLRASRAGGNSINSHFTVGKRALRG